MSAPPSTTVACPGCGSVLAAGGDDVPVDPGASAPCARLSEVTLRGPLEEAAADTGAAAMVRLADDAQHPADADLDVIDLPALVQSWARNVAQDWSA